MPEIGIIADQQVISEGESVKGLGILGNNELADITTGAVPGLAAETSLNVDDELAKLASGLGQKRLDLPEPVTRTLVRHAQEGDEFAMNEVCRRAIPFVRALASRYIMNKKNSVPYDDLVQAALREAPGVVGRYEPSRGEFLSFFASRAIGAMLDEQRAQMEISRNDLAELREISREADPRTRRTMIHNLISGQAASELPEPQRGPKPMPFVGANALVDADGRLGTDPISIQKLMYEHPGSEGGIVNSAEPVAPDDVPRSVIHKADEEMVSTLLTHLPERQRRAVLITHPELRTEAEAIDAHEPRTLKALAEEYGVSEGRMSQLGRQGLRNLRRIYENSRIEGPKAHPNIEELVADYMKILESRAVHPDVISNLRPVEIFIMSRLFQSSTDIAYETGLESHNVNNYISAAIKKLGLTTERRLSGRYQAGRLAILAAETGVLVSDDIPRGQTRGLNPVQLEALLTTYELMSQQKTAQKLGMSVTDVSKLMATCYKAMGVTDFRQAALLAWRDGLIEAQDLSRYTQAAA